jgi:hypothetical protein
LVTLRLLLAIGTLSACSFEARFDGTGYRCGTGDTCPSGQMCVDGYCRTGNDLPDSGTSDPDADVTTPDGAVTAGRCGGMQLLADDFADGTVGPLWYSWADTGAATVETGGHMAVQVQAGTADAWAGYSSASIYDLTDSALEAEVSQVGAVYTVLEARSWDDPRAQLLVENGDTLTAAVYNTGNNGVRNTTPYVADQHRFWRIREAGGTLYWETSADRGEWAELHSETNPFPPDHVHGIIAGGGQVAAGPDEMRFEQVSPGPAPAGYCAAATLVDDFATAPLRPLWDPWSDADCTVLEAAGELNFAFNGTGDSWCGAESFHTYDLRDSEVVVEVSQASVDNNYLSYVYVSVPRDSTTRLEIGMENGGLWLEQDLDDAEQDYAEVDWNATDHRFWRIANQDDKVILSTSPDGTTWTHHVTATPLFDLSAVKIVIAAGAWGAGPGNAVTTRFAGVNVP